MNEFFFVNPLQAIACYTPKFLWDAFEGGLLRTIVMGLNLGICREEEKQAKKSVILDYLTSHLKVSANSLVEFSSHSDRQRPVCKFLLFNS